MFIFLDTETTGTGPDDRLCQIAFKTENGQDVKLGAKLIRELGKKLKQQIETEVRDAFKELEEESEAK